MINLSHALKNAEIIVKAGLGSDKGSDDIFCYTISPLSKWIKSVDDPCYSAMSQAALQSAKKIVEETGKNVTLKYLVIFE